MNKEDKLKAALEEIVEGFRTQDEVDRINEDLKATRRLFLLFIISVALWAVVITALIQLVK